MSDTLLTPEPSRPDAPAPRSRLHLYAPFGAVLAAFVGGVVAYSLSRPLYRSDAVVRVTPPPYFGGENPPNENAVMSAEAYLIVSRPTISRAAQGPHWDAAWPTPDQLTASTDQHLEMEVQPDWKLRVVFQDYDPRTAQQCLQAIMLAYDDLKRERAARRRAMTQPVRPGDDDAARASAFSPSPPPPTASTASTAAPPTSSYIVSPARPATIVVDPRPGNAIWGAAIGFAAAAAGGLAFTGLRRFQDAHRRHRPPLAPEAAPADAKRP